MENPEAEQGYSHDQDQEHDYDQDSAPIGPAAARLAAVARPSPLATAAALDVGLGDGPALRPPAVGHDGLCRRLVVDDVTCLEVEVEVDTVRHLFVGGWSLFHHG